MSLQWQHNTTVVNGINIHYVSHGTGAPLLMLHGWPEFWFAWRKQIPVISEHYQVIAPDLRGFGYSDKPFEGYDTKTSAADMFQLTQSLGFQKVSLVAHDIGARVAFRYVLDNESSVDRVVLLDSTPPIEQLGNQPPSVIRERWHSYFHQQFDLPEKLIEGREEIYLRHIFRDWCINKYVLSDEEITEYVKAYSQPGALRGGFNYYRAAAYQDPDDWRAEAERVLTHPLLFLYGDRRVRTAQEMGVASLDDSWKKFFPNVIGRHMGNYGHFLQWETPDAVNRAILEFLDSD